MATSDELPDTLPPPPSLPTIPTEPTEPSDPSADGEPPDHIMLMRSIVDLGSGLEHLRKTILEWIEIHSKRHDEDRKLVLNEIQNLQREVQTLRQLNETVVRDHHRILDRVTAQDLTGPGSEGHPLRGEVVLVLEDDELLRRTMVQVCRQAGATVLAAKNLQEARLALIDPKIGIVSVDILLGTDDGMPFVRELLAYHQEVAVLIVTGTVLSSELQEAQALGVDVLQKPFGPQQLITAILGAKRAKP